MGLDPMQAHTSDLTDTYSAEITEWADAKVPPLLGNGEYAARCSALMISLARQLGRAAAAFGEANAVDPQEVGELVTKMVVSSHVKALDALNVAKVVN